MAQQAPLTQTQIPQDSILDLFGRQVYLGNAYVLPTSGKSLTDTSETPIAVIRNTQTARGKSFFIFQRKLASDLNVAVVRYYKNPTLNVPGSTTTALNLRLGATATSVATCYLGASITANGTLLTSNLATLYGSCSDLLIVVDPGTSLLITGQQAAVGTSVIVAQNAWYEI